MKKGVPEMFDFKQVALFKSLFVSQANAGEEAPETPKTLIIKNFLKLPSHNEQGRRNSFSLPRPQAIIEDLGGPLSRNVKGRRSLMATIDNTTAGRNRESLDSLSVDENNRSDLEPFSPKKFASNYGATDESHKRNRKPTTTFKLITEIPKSVPKEDTKVLSHSPVITDVILSRLL